MGTKRFILCIVTMVVSNVACFAQKTVSAYVVDDETGEELPFASVYALKGGVGTMSNSEGEFGIAVQADDTLRFTAVGYEPLLTAVSDLGDLVEMKPVSTTMREVTVTTKEGLLARIAARMEKDYRAGKKLKKTYFMRQSNLIDGEMQMVEAFVQAKAAVALRNIAFLAGRHYFADDRGGMQDDGSDLLWFSNMHQILCVSPMTKGDAWRDVLVTPFNHMPSKTRGYAYGEAYVTDVRRMFQSDGKETVAVSFSESGDKTGLPVLCGELYVDGSTLRPVAFDGRLENFRLRVWTGLLTKVKPAQVTLHIGFGEEDGTCAVTNMAVTLQCQDIKCNTVLYNVPDDGAVSGKTAYEYDNMLVAIERSEKDDALWDDEVVRKTDSEDSLAYARYRRRGKPDIVGTPDSDAALRRCLATDSARLPQEKVYLHLDNNCYFLGDTIWFKAYTRQTDYGVPSTVSDVLYAELLDNDGYVMQRKKIRMHAGEGNGEFALKADSSMYSGFYEVRAYTRWQLNWGRCDESRSRNLNYQFYDKEMADEFFTDYDKIYSRVVPVYDKPVTDGELYRDMTLRKTMRYYGQDGSEPKVNVRFYPEGGTMTAGVPCHVAFEATTEEGEYVAGTLEVDGETFPTVHRGRGEFTVTPKAKGKTRARFVYGEGEAVDTELPEAAKSGVSLHVSQDADSCFMEVTASGEEVPDSLGLSVKHDGSLLAYRPLVGRHSAVSCPNGVLACGVNQVTVFDVDGRVWADRLFFHAADSTERPTVEVAGVKEGYDPMSRIDLTLTSKAKGRGPSRCSVAIRDKSHEAFSYDNGNILTEMLLSSEIKGFVPDPRWYFSSDDAEHRKALDLLMMTQGWRRFEWKETVTDSTLRHAAEKELALEGSVHRYKAYHKENHLEYDQIKEAMVAAYETPEEIGKLDLDEAHHSPMKRKEGMGIERSESSEKKKLEKMHDRNYVFMSDVEKAIERRRQETMQFVEDVLSEEYGTQDINNLAYKGAGLRKVPASTLVHAELVQGRHATARETTAKDGKFRISLPRMQDGLLLHLSASDSSKWSKKKQHEWIVADENEYPEFYVKLTSPFIRAVKPYDFYRTHLPQTESREEIDAQLEGRTLRQVPAYAKNGRLIKRSHVSPALKLDAYEAFNYVSDAGLLSGWMAGRTSLARAVAYGYLGDMGLSTDYSVEVLPRFSMWDKQDLDKNENSYASFLNTKGADPQLSSDSEILKYSQLSHLDSVYIYTDFAPRQKGSWKYGRPNVPEVAVLLKTIPDDGQRVTYRDRLVKIQGFSSAAEFYSPDYSKHKLPEDIKDYRRTLYWNPNLLLDSNGEAHVTLYNNSRATSIQVDVQGQSPDGTLLWNE